MILFSEGNAFPLEFIGTTAAEEDEEPIRHGLVYVIALADSRRHLRTIEGDF